MPLSLLNYCTIKLILLVKNKLFFRIFCSFQHFMLRPFSVVATTLTSYFHIRPALTPFEYLNTLWVCNFQGTISLHFSKHSGDESLKIGISFSAHLVVLFLWHLQKFKKLHFHKYNLYV